MSTTGQAGAGAVGAPSGQTRPARRRRWYRLLVPFAVGAALVGFTLVARAVTQPDLSDPATLSASGAGPDGSDQLAGLLRAQGVEIVPVADVDAARAALAADDRAVLFVPKPTFAGATLVRQVQGSGDHRVVLVGPDRFQLLVTGLPVASGSSRWASRATDPGCTVPEATGAGVATALRHRYVTEDTDHTCYRGGLAYTRTMAGTEAFVVGATDPFRNGRIDEHNNTALALALLGQRDRVVWAGALPNEVDPQLSVPELGAPERSELDRSGGSAFVGLVAGYPQAVLVGLVLAAVAAVLLALARARRLGPPVREPLPVSVPAAEAVVGQGRLYQRGQDRAAALARLRAAAVPRLARAVGLTASPPPDPAALVAALASVTGRPVAQIQQTVYGPDPQSDEELTRAVAALDALVARVTIPNREESP